MRRFLKENGLGLVLLALFLATFAGNALAGYRADLAERVQHGQATVGFFTYLGSPHFLESLAENWESEFLQMAAYIWLTAFLRQKGSAESKPIDGEGDRKDEMRPHPFAPRVVQRGGLLKALYARSLSLALFGLFVVSFVLHGFAGAARYNDEQRLHGAAEVSVAQYFGTAQFWFESMQNWQSEFLSVLVVVVLSIWLRQKGSPESKPVNAPHSVTSEEIS